MDQEISNNCHSLALLISHKTVIVCSPVLPPGLSASKLQLLLSAHRPSDLVILGRFQCVSMMDGVKLVFVKVYMVKCIASNTYSTLQCEEW